MIITNDDVELKAERCFGILRPPTGVGLGLYHRKFIAHFACIPSVIAVLWNKVNNEVQKIEDINQLLWLLAALHFMNSYPTMAVLATKLQKSEDTVRKWVWQWIDMLARLPNVSDYVPSFRGNDSNDSESDHERRPSKQQRLTGKTD